jgi:hypothetical protein
MDIAPFGNYFLAQNAWSETAPSAQAHCYGVVIKSTDIKLWRRPRDSMSFVVPVD